MARAKAVFRGRCVSVAIGLACATLPGCSDAKQSAVAQAQVPAEAAPQPAEELSWTTGVWEAPGGLRQFPIWPDGQVPGADAGNPLPERVMTRVSPEAVDGDVSQAIFDVSDPTITIYPPKGESTGAAIIVFPGGGFKAVVVTLEGTEICDWVSARGITCILSKYRVPGTNHHWDEDCKCVREPDPAPALQDAQRTIKLVRSMADELDLDPAKIGVMGFSAGGYLVAQTSNIFEPDYAPVDAVDEISSRPDFAVTFFPGHICRPGDTLDPGLKVTASTPPTFLVSAWDDPTNDICNSTIYARALNSAGVPSEIHIFATGGHAFGLRRDHSPDTAWPPLLENWLREQGVL